MHKRAAHPFPVASMIERGSERLTAREWSCRVPSVNLYRAGMCFAFSFFLCVCVLWSHWVKHCLGVIFVIFCSYFTGNGSKKVLWLGGSFYLAVSPAWLILLPVQREIRRCGMRPLFTKGVGQGNHDKFLFMIECDQQFAVGIIYFDEWVRFTFSSFKACLCFNC